MPDYAGLGAAIRRQRKRLKLSQKQLEELTASLGDKVTERTIGAIERGGGENSQLATRRGIMTALGWTVESWNSLLEGEEPTLLNAAPSTTSAPLETNVGPVLDDEPMLQYLSPDQRDAIRRLPADERTAAINAMAARIRRIAEAFIEQES